MDALGAFESAGRLFRRRRMRLLLSLFDIAPDWRVLDVGGTMALWQFCPVRPRLVLVNLPRAWEPAPPEVEFVQGDGVRLPFADRSFDLVFSNSVIEHLGPRPAMESFAKEIRRTGRRYFVQTPDAAFPIEPHLYTPFLHYLPAAWQQRIAPRFSVWSLLSRASAGRREFYLRHYFDDIRLLGAADMRRLFPEARLLRERCAGLSKSLIAVHGARAAPL